MQVTAIVVAAGKGKRFGQGLSKPLALLDHRPLVIYSLRVLSKHPAVSEIVVVANRGNRSAIVDAIKKYRIRKVKSVVLGGARRQDSVANGLKAGSASAEFVLIHDAARPFIDRQMVTRAIEGACKYGAAIAAIPVKSTIKSVKRGMIAGTVCRDTLWEAQTPQVFRRSLISKVYAVKSAVAATDDAFLIERLGRKVAVVEGSDVNLKITTKSDLLIAEGIIRVWR